MLLKAIAVSEPGSSLVSTGVSSVFISVVSEGTMMSQLAFPSALTLGIKSQSFNKMLLIMISLPEIKERKFTEASKRGILIKVSRVFVSSLEITTLSRETLKFGKFLNILKCTSPIANSAWMYFEDFSSISRRMSLLKKTGITISVTIISTIIIASVINTFFIRYKLCVLFAL